MFGLIQVVFFYPNLQRDIPPTHGGEVVFYAMQVACHQSKQVTGLGVRVFPSNKVTTALQLAALNRVTVSQ